MSERTCANCKAMHVFDEANTIWWECRLHPHPTPIVQDYWCLDWIGKEKAQAVTQGTTSRKTVYPSDFVPNERAEAMAKAQGQNIHAMVAEWRDYHKAKGSLMADWQASLMNWLRNEVKFKEGRR